MAAMTNIAGTYKLFNYGYHHKDDDRFEPISDWYQGLIHYSDTGHMNVVLRFAEKPEEFADVVAYSGTYRVEGSKIIHDVTMSARPEYEGQRLDRDFKIEGDVLELIFEDTDKFKKAALWRKV
jgi:hypothetical protein